MCSINYLDTHTHTIMCDYWDCVLLQTLKSPPSHLCNNITYLQEMNAAKRQRVRSYVLTSAAHGCTEYRTKLVYLVIDELEMSDAGNYTCYAKGQAVTAYQVEIAPGKPAT